jgi:hypothetical protein
MSKILALVAAAFVLAGWILVLMNKRKLSVNQGWYTFAFAFASAALALRASGVSGHAVDWWDTVICGLLSLVLFIAGIMLLSGKARSDAVTEKGTKLLTGKILLDGALFAVVLAGIYIVIRFVVFRP